MVHIPQARLTATMSAACEDRLLLLRDGKFKLPANIKMKQDVGIAERQKVKKQGTDDHISIQPPIRICFHYVHITEKIPVVRCILTALWDHPTLFPYFLPFCYPYILSHFFNVFYYL